MVKNYIIFGLLALVMLFVNHAYAIDKPPPPAPTGNATLDAINKFGYDTAWWQPGDPIPDTGSSTLNSIAAFTLGVANYGSNTSVGAGGSWGDGTSAGDPYTGGGGNMGGGGAGSTTQTCKWKSFTTSGTKLFNSASDAGAYNCSVANSSGSQVGGFAGFTSIGGADWHQVQCQNGVAWTIQQACDVHVCADGQTYNDSAAKCLPVCPDRYVFDQTQNKCLLDPNQCKPPYTLVSGVCVAPKTPDPETKTCPVGYTLTGGTCVKDPDKPCDPSIQQCNPDGTAKCDCCSKLDTIIGNQGQQINLANRTNELLAQSNANQLTANLKLDNIGQKIDGTNQLLVGASQSLAKQNQLTQSGNDILTQIEKNTRPTSATASTGVGSTDLSPVTARQDDQTAYLKQIEINTRPNSTPASTPVSTPTPDSDTISKTDPFSALSSFDISQNRIHSAGQCPADKTINVMSATFTFRLSLACQFLASLSPIFLALAFFKGASIIVRGTE